MHQTSKLSRCLKQIKLQIMEHLRETMHCNVAKVFLDAHLNSYKAWISLDISGAFDGSKFSNYFVKLGVYVWTDRRLQKDFQPTMYVQSLRIISFDAPAFAIKKMKPVSVKLVFWFVNPLIVSITYTHCTKHPASMTRGSIFFAFRIKH